MTTDRSDLHAQERAQRAQLIASILGEKDIRLVKWQQLMREGIVIKLKIRRVRFKKRLELKDLGLELPADAKERKAVESLFNLGNKALLPLERLMQLEALESKARKLLSRSSHATEWGSFVPVTQYKAWCEKNEELRQEYFALRDQILRDYKQIVTQVMREYVKAARYTFNILHRIKADEVLSAELDLKKRTYVALVAKSVRENMPTPEEISASFRFEVLKTYIDLPELAQKALPMIAEESPEVREYELQEQSMRERERMLREMNEDVLKAAREQKEELIDSFLGTLVTQTRALIYDASLNVAAAIKSGAGLRPGIITQLKTLVEQVASLKFYDDRDVDKYDSTGSLNHGPAPGEPQEEHQRHRACHDRNRYDDSRDPAVPQLRVQRDQTGARKRDGESGNPSNQHAAFGGRGPPCEEESRIKPR